MYDSNGYAASFDMTTSLVDSNSQASRFQAIREHLFSELHEEAVILSLRNGKYYGLNSVGITIWKNVREAATSAEIEAAVLDEYDVDEETCRREVSSFLEKMLKEDLIEAVDEPGA